MKNSIIPNDPREAYTDVYKNTECNSLMVTQINEVDAQIQSSNTTSTLSWRRRAKEKGAVWGLVTLIIFL